MGTTSEAATGNRNRYKPNHSPELVARARLLWDQGKTASEVAWFVGLSREAVCALARRQKFTSRRKITEDVDL